MNDTTGPSEQRTLPEHVATTGHPDAADYPPRPPVKTDDEPEYHRRGPKLLASMGNTSWVRRAERERLAKQRKGQDTTYVHRWWLKDQHSAKTPVITKDAQALANTWGRPIGHSADEPDADPVFSPTEIRFNATENGCDDFRFPPDWDDKEQAGYGSCNTDMLPYNQLVAAVMLAVKHHLGDDVVVESDGDYCSGTWSAAVNLYLRTFPDRDVPDLDNWPGAQGHMK